MRSAVFLLLALAVAAAVYAAAQAVGNNYVFYAGYIVLQYVVVATAWNILGGYTGYVNFGSSAFFAIGAYTTVVITNLVDLPLPVMILAGGLIASVVGLGMGYLTLRLRGVFFAIATLALVVVLETFAANWEFVGGGRGTYMIRPRSIPLFDDYIHYLFAIMLVLSAIAITTARLIQRSQLGYGFATIRDDELAAEASGVPTLPLKLVATTLSGAFMGMAGAPYPYYITHVQPATAFALDIGVNAIAMPMIGGTTSWVGPLVGALLLGTLQQLATVTISSTANLMIVGVVLIVFVVAAPDGIIGLVRKMRERWKR